MGVIMKKDKREIYAERKNCTISNISRIVSIDEDILNDYEVGAIISSPGLSWTDGGEFEVAPLFGYVECVYRIVNSVECHKVDYSDQEELYDISAQDCECEKEYLVNHNKFQVLSVMRADEEVNFWTIEIEAIVD